MATWSRTEAREFVFVLVRLLGGGGIHAIRLHCDGLAFSVEVVGLGGRVTTPLLDMPEPAEQFFQSAEFELPQAMEHR